MTNTSENLSVLLRKINTLQTGARISESARRLLEITHDVQPMDSEAYRYLTHTNEQAGVKQSFWERDEPEIYERMAINLISSSLVIALESRRGEQLEQRRRWSLAIGRGGVTLFNSQAAGRAGSPIESDSLEDVRLFEQDYEQAVDALSLSGAARIWVAEEEPFAEAA